MARAGRDGARSIAIVSNDLAYLVGFRGPVIRRLAELGHRLTLVAPAGAGAAAAKALGVALVEWNVRKATRNPFADVAAFRRLLAALRRAEPDTLYAETIKPVILGLTAARLLRIPRRVVMLPGLGYAFTEGAGLSRPLTALAARGAYRLSLPSADAVICHNADDAALLSAQRIVRDRRRIWRVNGSGVDLAHFAPSPPPAGPPVFAMAARLLRDKGVAEFAGAARLVRRRRPEARFVLAGRLDPNPSAIRPAALEAWVAAGDLAYVGELADVRPLLAACHAFVLPSYREGLPRTCLEAMASGRAVVTTDVAGCRDVVVPGETGLLVRPRDPEALAAALVSLIDAPQRLAEMGAKGRAVCEARFEAAAIADQVAALILGDGSAQDHPVVVAGLDERARPSGDPREQRDGALAAR